MLERIDATEAFLFFPTRYVQSVKALIITAFTSEYLHVD